MKIRHQSSLVSVWHHRVLGVLWVLWGAVSAVGLDLDNLWKWRIEWLPALLGLVFIIAGVGFALVRDWARSVMAVLSVVGGLYFADMILMAGWVGNRPLLHWMLAAFGLAGYTATFILISAVWRWSHPR